jgi:hypothetical protein
MSHNTVIISDNVGSTTFVIPPLLSIPDPTFPDDLTTVVWNGIFEVTGYNYPSWKREQTVPRLRLGEWALMCGAACTDSGYLTHDPQLLGNYDWFIPWPEAPSAGGPGGYADFSKFLGNARGAVLVIMPDECVGSFSMTFSAAWGSDTGAIDWI